MLYLFASWREALGVFDQIFYQTLSKSNVIPSEVAKRSGPTDCRNTPDHRFSTSRRII